MYTNLLSRQWDKVRYTGPKIVLDGYGAKSFEDSIHNLFLLLAKLQDMPNLSSIASPNMLMREGRTCLSISNRFFVQRSSLPAWATEMAVPEIIIPGYLQGMIPSNVVYSDDNCVDYYTRRDSEQGYQ